MAMKRIAFLCACLLSACSLFAGEDVSEKDFSSPDRYYYPQTWFHFIDGNVDKEGISRDLEAIASAGISGIHFFHGGQFGGDWPGVRQHIECLSPLWNDALEHTASEAKRLGLSFTMQNCPGWSLAGGPWIKPEDSMRALVCSQAETSGGHEVALALPVQVREDESSWRDYRDVAVLAFPTPDGGIDRPAVPESVDVGDCPAVIAGYFSGDRIDLNLPPAADEPHRIVLDYGHPVTIRSLVITPNGQLNHSYCFELQARFSVNALAEDGKKTNVLDIDVPMLNWQDDKELTLALDESRASRYEILIDNRQDLNLKGMRLVSAARKNNWEAEAAWTLRGHIYESEYPEQSSDAFIAGGSVIDVSDCLGSDGIFRWDAPEGDWTVMRIGHVNTGYRNAPAPPEATGWECDKLSSAAADKHFEGYIGKALAGPVNGRLDAMLLDSWECNSQTWTPAMEREFRDFNGYDLRSWMPALFGYVIDSHETTFRFLSDWRSCINYLFTERFWGRMAENARNAGIGITYETAAGDVFPADILEYFKYADVPMCEFWNDSHTDCYVGSINFKPVRPTASAARLYGKKRCAAESLTSFELTWDEHFSRWKDIINQNFSQGVTYSVFHTYTHNPCADTLFPGTSFGGRIGTPFLRAQTWWKHMPEFTSYVARLSYMLESGEPVSDVLWYLGDGNMHKPDQNCPFPAGYKYDYCNQDILLNRISVTDGKLVTPEGIRYSVLWMPDNRHMLPATAARIRELVEAGATVIGDAPQNVGTLVNTDTQAFVRDVQAVWGGGKPVHKLGRGLVISGMSLDKALFEAGLRPDLTAADGSESPAKWMHRSAGDKDFYFIAAPLGNSFSGTLEISGTGALSIWDPVSGEVSIPDSAEQGEGCTRVRLNLPYAGSCFLVFDHSLPFTEGGRTVQSDEMSLDNEWTLTFPQGWGVNKSLQLERLVPWKDLPVSEEGKAFSGTAVYSKELKLGRIRQGDRYVLDLGTVDEVAKVFVNGREVRTLWCEPYKADITDYLHRGNNKIEVEITGTWYNRLVYDAGRPEDERKTWVIHGPSADSPLRDSGLLGPVRIIKTEEL